MGATNRVNVFAGPGTKGNAGKDGTNGKNAFSRLATGFLMPNVGATVTVDVDDSSWIVPSSNPGLPGEVDGQTIVVQFAGSFLATAAPSPTSVTLYNLGYDHNSAPGTPIPAGATIAPGGQKGEPGTIPGGALVSANNLSDLTSIAAARTNLGLGALATLNVVTDTEFSGTLSVGKGGTGATDAGTARTNLGLGTMATQSAGAVAIIGGAISGVTLVATTATLGPTTVSTSIRFDGTVQITPSGVQSLLAATAITPNAPTVKVAGNAAAVTLTALPTITTPSVGQILRIRGTDDTNTVTLQDESNLAGTKLKLGAATRVLGNGDTLQLEFDSTTGFWYETGFSTVV